MQVGIALSPAKGTATVVSASGSETETNPAGKVLRSAKVIPITKSRPADGLGSYACIIDVQKNRNFRAYTPWHAAGSGSSWEIDYLGALYSVDDARFVSGHATFQATVCTAGGGTTSHAWHQYLDGGAIWYDGSADSWIGRRWANHQTNGTVVSSLNFSVSAAPAQIGGSVGITVGSFTYTGDPGADPNITPSIKPAYNVNRINTFFVSASNHWWDGTGSFEGNTGQELYEWPEASTTTYYFNSFAELHALRGSPFGCDPF